MSDSSEPYLSSDSVVPPPPIDPAVEEANIDKEIDAVNLQDLGGPARGIRFGRLYVVVGLTYFNRIVLAISFTLFCISTLLSYYGVIILNFVFFMSTIMSYIIAPLYHGLGNDWPGLAYAFLQVIGMTPLIEFFILFLVESVGSLADSIMHIIPGMSVAFTIAMESSRSKLRVVRKFRDLPPGSMSEAFAWLGVAILAGVGGIGVVYVTFLHPDTFPLLGLVAYIAIVLQILWLFVPTYGYWWRMLLNRGSSAAVFQEEILHHFQDDVYPEIEDMLGDSKSRESQTYLSAFAGPTFANLDLLSEDESEMASTESTEGERKGNAGGIFAVPDSEMMLGGDSPDIKEILQGLFPMVTPQAYFPCFNYSLAVGQNRTQWLGKCVALVLAVLVNLGTIGYDVYRGFTIPNAYFSFSIIVRVVFLPLISYFHWGVVYFERPPQALAGIMKVCPPLAIIILLVTAVGIAWLQTFKDAQRIEALPPPTWDNATFEPNLWAPACTWEFAGVNLMGAIGYALGGYDYDRDPTVFDAQMAFFFGHNWSSFIHVDRKVTDHGDPFLVYENNETGVVVFGFRGFVSGSEITLQIEMIVSEYLLPLLAEIVPFYDMVGGFWLGWWIELVHALGVFFFNPSSVSRDMIYAAMDVYDERGYNESDVIFSGINTGGLYAKALSLLLEKPGVGFLSFPVFTDYFTSIFDLDGDAAWWITNVHTQEGLFTTSEPELAINFAIPWIVTPSFFDNTVFGTLVRDTVYKSFCILAELCGGDDQFWEYCNTTIGWDEVELLRESLENYLW
jgi:hypothetical protein